MKKRDASGVLNYYQGAIFFIFAAFVFLLYSNIFNAPFVVDDISSIIENRHIRMTGITPEQVKEILTSPSPRPVANLSFALNYYSDQYNPVGYHLVNIIIHIINGILLFLLIKTTIAINFVYNTRAVKEFSYHKYSGTGLNYSELIAFCSAMLWLVNPLHTQSVTYTVQRMNSMAAMFYLLSLLLYIKGRLSQKQLRKGLNPKIILLYAGSIIAGIFALASKEIAATLPLIIIVYEWFFFQDLRKFRSKKSLLQSICAIILFCIGAWLLFSLNGNSPQNIILSMYKYQDFNLIQRLFTELRVVVYYISLVLFPDPSRLNLVYNYPVSYSMINSWTTLLGFGVIIGLTGFAVFTVKKDRLVSFCIFWFLANLVIESSVIGLALIFEHRTYLPSMMVCFLFVIMVFRFVRNPWLLTGLMCLILISQSVWTYQRNNIWSDKVSLWRDGVSKSPDNAWMYLNLGVGLADHDQDETRPIYYIQKALQKKPDFPEALFALGVAYANQNRKAEAIDCYERALKLNPNFTKAHYELGLSMVYSGNMKGAFDHFSKAVLLDPENSKSHSELGNVLSQTGNLPRALEHYTQALRLDPDNSLVYNNMGNTYARMGNLTQAIDYYRKTLQMDPKNLDAQRNLLNVLKVYQAPQP